MLICQKNIRIERIVSQGHITPFGVWYEQTEHEWVIVLQGHATIEYENKSMVELKVGDYLYLPAKTKHRVAFTAENQQTIWLAIHWLEHFENLENL